MTPTVDTDALRQRVDLLALIGQDTPLRRVAGTQGGEYAGPCPFCGGTDRLRVQPARGRWWCRQCSPDARWHDAIAYVMRRDGLDFRAACARLDGGVGAQPPAPVARAMHYTPARDAPAASWQDAALAVVVEAEAALWADVGLRAREWLAWRGLSDATLRAWRIGYNPQDARRHGLYVPRGILIPWFCDGQVWQLKVRRGGGSPKYLSVQGGRPLLFGGHTLAGRQVAVLVEGEFDAMLLHQEAGAWVGVATLGSASAWVDARVHLVLAQAARLLLAYDLDEAGERAAWERAALSARMRQIRLPAGPWKDITDFWQAGGRLHDWVTSWVARLGDRALLPERAHQ